MNIREKLSQRMGIFDIREINAFVQGSDKLQEELYALVFDTDDTVAVHATWVLCHIPASGGKWLYSKQDELIDEVIRCAHHGKRRQLLNILQRQTFTDTPRIDFLDFCLESMMSKDELPAVKTLCIKLAFALSKNIPELLKELTTLLEIMEPDLLPPSISSVRRNTLKAIKKHRSSAL